MYIFYTPNIRTTQELSEEEAKHCVKVLRMTEGDELLLTDGLGYFYKAIITQAHPKHCLFDILEEIPTPLPWHPHIHIAVAPTKNMDRMEWFAEKATEIGINEISFLRCRYSERKEIKNPRIEKILVSAMKQSQKAVLPVLNEMQNFEQFIKQPHEGQKFIAHCHPGDKPCLTDIYKPGDSVTLLIGPEGDFSENEVAMAESNGFISISLSDSRLRTETAALVACHTIHISIPSNFTRNLIDHESPKS